MNSLIIISIITFLIYIELGLYVLLKNVSSKINRSFFYLCIGMAIWSFSFVFLYGAESFGDVKFWTKFGAVGWCLIPAWMIKFNSYLANFPLRDKMKNMLFAAFLIPGIYFLYTVFSENWILFDTSKYYSDGSYFYDTGSFFAYLYLIYFFAFVLLLFLMIVNWRNKVKEKNEKKQFNIILITLSVCFLWIAVFEIALPLLYIYPYPFKTHIVSLIYFGGLAYSVLKFRLFIVTPSLVADKVVNSLNEILLFTDIKTKILRSNAYTQKLLGYDFSKIYGKPLKTLFAESKRLEHYIYLALINNVSTSLETSMRPSSGILIPVKIFILIVKDEFGDNLGVVLHGYDNREGIKLEEEIKARKKTEQKLKNKGNILERLVSERKKELEKSYKELQVKIADRMRIEEQIKSDISEKEVLINEIHNRVISNMNMIISLVNAQTPHKLSIKAYRKLQEFNQRVKSMLLVHDNLYLSINYSDVDFAGFLNAIIDDLIKIHDKQKKIVVKRKISNAFLNIDFAIPLGLIANELITNAFVHAFPKAFLQRQINFQPTVFINYSFDNDYYYLMINDNGKKIPKNLDVEKLKTTGLPLVDILVKEQFNGSWSIGNELGSFIKVALSSEK